MKVNQKTSQADHFGWPVKAHTLI